MTKTTNSRSAGKVPFDALLQEAHDVEAWLKTRVKSTTASRVGAYRRSLQEMLDLADEPLSASKFEKVVRAAHVASHEVQELHLIATGLGSHVSDTDAKLLVSDHPDVATATKPHEPGRNKQFELYLTALLRRAGLAANLDEPDVVFTFEAASVSAAAKRVLSKDEIKKRVIDGARQVERAGMAGLIVVDLSRVANPESRLVGVPAANDALELLEAYGRSSGQRIANMVGQRPHLWGLGVRVSCLMRVDDHGLGLATRWHFTNMTDDKDEVARLARFVRCFEGATA